MKRLESIKVVQFFLFEKEELRIRDITGIFGRNGSGKSAFLDAVQIAMLGANKNLMAFNAQADERTTRSISAYCLGQYGPGDQRVRDRATTYITLVWRDTVTGEPISMGVCLSASDDNDTHTVLGRYLAHGVELSMGDHLETVDGAERPRDWRVFRVHLAERSARISGESDPFFDDARRYITAAMIALRGGGGVPAYEAYTRAFRFALRMRFDKSVDHIVRHDVLENRPTNVSKFRQLTDTFSKLNSMVAYVEKKVEDGSKVMESFTAALMETRRSVTWNALGLTARRAHTSDAVNAAADKSEMADTSLATLKLAYEAASLTVKDLEKSLEHHRALMEAHAAHKDHAEAQSSRETAEGRVVAKQCEVDKHFGDVRRLLVSTADNPYLFDFRPEMLATAEAVKQTIGHPEAMSASATDKVMRSVMKLASRISSSLFGAMRTIESQLGHVENDIENTNKAIERVRSGKAPLSDPAQRLLSELRDNGLLPTPVCDVVRINEPDWQPVVEAFLGRNVEALLVDGTEEAKAFGIYREMGGRRGIHGVKIAMSSRQKLGEAVRTGSVAELIEGSNSAAVAYLRRQLGDIMRADTNVDALAGGRTLTKDGMLVGPGSFERLERISVDRLKIGAVSDGQLGHLKETLRKLDERKQTVTGEKNKLQALMGGMATLSHESTLQLILANVSAMQEARGDLERALARITETSDSEYQALCDKVLSFKAALPGARDAEQKAFGGVIKAEGLANHARRDLEEKKQALTKVANEADVARDHLDYDNMFASEQWDRLLSRFDEDYAGMASHCAEHFISCAQQAHKASLKAAGSFATYLSDYRESPGPEICDDWRKSAEWISAQVERLRGTELLEHKERAAEAYRASQDAFRTDVAIALNERFEHLDQTVDRLNAALKDCPVFSNGERYQFLRTIRPDLKGLMKFVKDIAAFGAVDDLLGGPGETPPEFEALLREKVTPGASGEKSPLDDYREFFEFDIEIKREDPTTRQLKSVGMLSKRLGAGSGGEHRSPLYVIAGAALASAYRLDKNHRDGISLILLDEAFDKMDMTNLIATMRYLEDLGLQVLLASPGENQGALNAFMHRYYEVQRDSFSNKVLFEGHDVSATMREAYRDDLPEFNPDLIEHELEAMRQPVPEAL